MFRSSFRCLKILGAGLLVLFSTHLSALTIDTTSRSAVTTAYDTYLSAFNVPSGWTGNVANCDAGTTSPEYQQATIDTINFYRAMAAGVYSYSFGPVNLVTDDTINRRARQAALYMAANGTQSLSPPAGNCYNASTSADIIAGIGASMLSFGHPASSFAGPGAIAQYMNDAGNEATLAYRRALLYSQQIGIATGDIVDDSAPSSYSANALRFKPAPGEQSNLFTAVSIYASSFITAWPNANFIPYPLVPSSGFWSFSIQQSPFNIDSNTVVTMARSDGTPVPIAKAVALPTGYGDATLLFEPVGLSFAAGMADTSYKITVSFLMSAGGSYSYYNSQCYTVTVFDPAQSSGNDVAPNLCYNTDDAQTPYVSTVQSQNITYAQNALATPISVNADVSDGGTLSYQWYSNTANSVYGGTPIGTNDPTYTPNTANVGTLYYYVVVTNTNPAATGAKTASATFMVAGVSVIASLGSNTIDLSLANPPASGTGWTYSESVNTSSGMDGVYTILDGANVLVINNCYYDSTSTTYSSRHFEVEAAATATITLNNMSIGGAGCSSASSALLLDAGADVTLILADDSTNTMGAGIQTTGAKLTINGEAKSTGVLTVNSFSTGAAIGGGTGVYDPISTTFIPGSGDGGTLIINGGTINAVGGYYGAGIGGGYGAGGNITINGGTVNATSSSMDSGGAGIGGGYGSMVNSDGGAITINDGTVNARGCGGAGIGGGSGIGSASGSITINGGNITVGNSSNLTGSACASSYKGNGIGSGGNSYSTSSTSGSITINGGTIYALGQNAGIGSSLGNETITITGGTITAIGSGGAGIGNGYTYDYSASPPTYTGVNNIIISGGMITAIGSSGAGIGGAGNTYDGGNITITGGTITAISNLGQGAGIGDAGPTGNGSNIIISGGAIFAYAGDNSGYGYGAGIGGGNSYGSNGNIGNILIYGENTFVTAQGGSDGGQDIGIGYCSSDPCPVDNVFVALPKGNLKNASGVIGNDVLFTATPKSVAGIVETTLPPPFDAAPFPGVNGVYDLMTGLDPTGKTFSVITTYGSSDPIPFALSGYSVTPDPATGSYLLGTGATVIFSAPSGTPLTFTYDPSFDIPASTVGTPITDIDVSGGVSGGAQPYTFSATGLPDGISISTTGVISGTPTTATPCATSCTATLTVTDDVNATASITINYGTITPAGSGSTYAITLAPPGPYDFGSLDAGYASTALLPQTVTVTNSGDAPTGPLTVTLSGTNATDFSVSTDTLASLLAAGNQTTFDVEPNVGLAAGTYTATLTVAGDHAISQSVDLSFEVTTPPSGSTYAITLDQSILYQTTPYDFGTEMVGYAPLTPLTATVTNTGTQPTGALAVSLSGTDANAFSISADNVSGSGLALGASGTFAVAPKTGLAAGTYNATVTVSGANVTTQSFEVSFIVSPITPASAPVITPSSLPSGIIGSPYTATLAASNSPTSWVIVGGTLPLGLTLNTTSGEIAGTPLGPVGTSSFTVTASNGTGTSASVQFNILISPPPGGGSGATPSIPALNPAMLMLLALMLAITAAFRTAPRVTRNKKR